MKIQGKKIEGANEVIIVIPRGSNSDIVLKAQAVLDMEPFDVMCPPPEPVKRTLPGGKEVKNFKDASYLKSLDNHSVKRLNWIVLTSLEATAGLEWDKINLSDPTTWNNFEEEMKEAGFSNVEVNRIVAACIEVNALNEEKIQEARERFLLESQEQDEE